LAIADLGCSQRWEQGLRYKAKTKDLTFKAKLKAKDLKIVLKDSLRPRPMPRTAVTGYSALQSSSIRFSWGRER